jgi:mannose-6-phosphate isomerase-like protein (cupin superfamily)
MMRIISSAGRFTVPSPGGPGSHWIEHLSVADLSVGTYSIRAGGTDGQVPHTEDEIYVIMSGHATLVAGGDSQDVGPGAVIYVAAGEDHHFQDVAEDLAALVLFAPPEGARG